MLQKFCWQTSGFSRTQFEPLAHFLWVEAETAAREVPWAVGPEALAGPLSLLGLGWGRGVCPALLLLLSHPISWLVPFLPHLSSFPLIPEERLRQFGPAQGIWGEDLLVLSKHLSAVEECKTPRKQAHRRLFRRQPESSLLLETTSWEGRPVRLNISQSQTATILEMLSRLCLSLGKGNYKPWVWSSSACISAQGLSRVPSGSQLWKLDLQQQKNRCSSPGWDGAQPWSPWVPSLLRLMRRWHRCYRGSQSPEGTH